MRYLPVLAMYLFFVDIAPAQTIVKTSFVELSWTPPTLDTEGQPIASPIMEYEVAITDGALVDLNAQPNITSWKLKFAAPATPTKDITAFIVASITKGGSYKFWLRCQDGYNWSAWSAPFPITVILIAPAPPTALKVNVR